jgi:hypothetical protein
MAARKLKLIWQQVHDSSSHLYQPWSFLNIDQSRKATSNHVNASMANNELHHLFYPTNLPMLNAGQVSSGISMLPMESNTLIHSTSLTKPSVYQPLTEATVETYVAPAMPYATLNLHSQSMDTEPSIQPMLGKYSQARYCTFVDG